MGEMLSFPERKEERERKREIKQAISASSPDVPTSSCSPDLAPSIGSAENSPRYNGAGGPGGAALCYQGAQIQAVLSGFSPSTPTLCGCNKPGDGGDRCVWGPRSDPGR